ncbi:MAG: T9SS type A sorting domain-containing protein [Cyclobacteriaceae bacterium]|nr:T9SS type A sorting domain-containing protein [Cyclobacteriaceae bacterium]
MERFYLFLVFVLVSFIANAQTITISQETGGVSTSPLVSGATDIAIMGILFDKSSGGTCELDAITIDLTTAPTGVLTNPRLYRSTNNIFEGIASENLVSTGSIVGSTFVFDETATFITDFNNSSSQVDRFIFVVVDVAASLNASTPSIQPTLTNTNVTSAGCTVNAGTVTGTNFSFLGLTIGSLNAGANNVAGSPLIAGANGQAVFGFSLTSNGSQTVTVANVQLSTDPATKLSSYSLVRSVDADFATTGDNTTIGGLTFTPSATQVAITGLNESITSTASNYFLVANINPAVNGATSNIQASLVAANITANTGGKEGTSTGTDYGFTTATTTISSLNGGANNVATSPITAGATGRAIFGFSLTSNGSQTATALNVQFTADPTTSKYSNYSLVKSVDADFASSGDNSPVAGLTFTPSATEVVITGLNQSLNSTASNYFLVVDINAAATGNIQASLGNTNITLATGLATGSSTGTDYSFAPLTTTIASLNTGANNVATSPITAGATGQAIFGFSLTSNGAQTATALNIQFTADPTASKYSNYSLVKSVDADFASSGDNSTVAGLTFTPSATEVVITGLSQSLSSTASNYFLVVDVNAAASGNIQASLGSANITLGAGSATGSSTGTNYSFAPLTTTIASLNAGANNVATSPIVTGGVGKAIFGFSLTSNGLQTATAINIQLNSTPVGKYSNYSLVKSTDANFATSGNNTTVPGLTFTPSATQVAITGLTEAISGVSSNYFLVVDVDPGATGTVQASLTNTNITVGSGSITGSATGTNYSFAPLTATITSLNTGANNVALSPLEAGTSGRGIFGFALSSNGSQTVSVINIQLSANPSGKWSSFSLISSTDADFGTTGNNTVVPTSSINVTGVAPFEVQITPTTPIDITSAKNLFLIANVNPSLTSVSTPIQASLGTANFTVSGGVKTGSALGTNYSFNSSQSTTITVDYDGQSGPGFLDLGDYSKQSSTGLTTGNSEKIFGISINDSDPDSHGTTVTSLTVQLSNFANLNAIALFDGGTQVPGTELDIASSIVGNQITFSPINIVANDNSSKIIDVYVTFAPSVADNQFITASITGAVATTTGSGLATLGTIQTDPTKNKINVVATEMQFTAITPGIIPAMDFGLTVLATDNLGNQDFNTTGNVVLSKQSGPGSLSSTDAGGLTRSFSSGSVSWSQLELTLAGDYTIRANHSGSLPNKDEPITVTSLGIQIAGPTNQNFCFGGVYTPLNTITLTEADPSDFKIGSARTYSFILPTGFEFNTSVTPTPTETGSNVSAISAINYPTNSIARFSYTVTAENSSDAIIISGLEVRYTGTAVVSNQEIHRIGGNAYQEGNNDTDGNVHGTLSASNGPTPVDFINTNGGSIQPDETRFSITSPAIILQGKRISDAANLTGVFSGTGVLLDNDGKYKFNPSQLAPGNNYVVTFIYTEPGSPFCQNRVDKVFEVFSTIITNLNPEYCIDDAASTGLTPSNFPTDQCDNNPLPLVTNLVDSYEFVDFVYWNGSSYQPIPAPNDVFNPGDPIHTNSINTYGAAYIGYRVRYMCPTPGAPFVWTATAVTVHRKPNISFNPLLPAAVCEYETPINLEPTPIIKNNGFDEFFSSAVGSPGTSAPGVTGTFAGGYKFNPALGIGSSTTPVDVQINFRYRDEATTCTNEIAKVITVNPTPDAVPTVDLQGNTTTQNICQFGTAPSFTAIGTANYNWYNVSDALILPNSSTFTPSIPTQLDPSTTGNTTFKVSQTIAGCEGPLTPVTVVVHQPVTVDAGSFGVGGICFNDDIEMLTFNIPASITGFVSTGNWNDFGAGGQFFDVTHVTPDNSYSTSRFYQPTVAQYNSGTITLQLVSDSPSTINPSNPCPIVSDLISIPVNPVPPAPLANQPPDFCVGIPVSNLTASGSSLKWYTDPGLTNNYASGSPVSPLGVTGLVPSNDDFYVTQSESGCEGPATQVNVIYNATPIADFSVVNQCLGEEMEFSSIPESTIASGTIVKWGWQFGDGDNVLIPGAPVAASDVIPSTETGPQTSGTYSSPKHIFATDRDYNIRLTVISDLGCQNSISKIVEVGPVPQTGFSYKDLCDGETTDFLFDAGSGFPIAKLSLWEWDFGDPVSGSNNTISGSSLAEGNPSHQFSGVNSYNVSLRLVTDLGCEDTETKIVSILPYVTGFPYRESFEQLNHGWAAESYTSTTDLSWQWTAPSSSTINSASDGVNAWFAHDNISGQYFNDERSVLNGPCFDMTQVQRPVLSFDYWNNTDLANDGVYIEVSTDGGASWTVLGETNEGLNWYNRNSILGLSQLSGIGQTIEQKGWSGNSQAPSESNGWTPAKYSLDGFSTESKLRIRYVFGTNGDNPSGVDGFAMDDFAIESRNRTLLAENFTNAAAPGAAINSTSFQNFNNGASFNELVRIQYHTSIGGNDPLHLSNPADPNARAAFYGVTNSFRGYLDGKSDGAFSPPGTLGQGWAGSEYDSRTLVASPLEIAISSPATPADLFNIEAEITAIDDLDPGQYAVQIAIVEKQVGTEGFVLRKMLPDASGTPLTAITNGAVQSVTVSTELTNIADPNEIAVVAFVQQMNGQKEVLQARLLDGIPAPPIITGLEYKQYGDLIRFYPNPADEEVTILLPTTTRLDVPVRLADPMGKIVYDNTIPAGESTKTINTRNLTGGIYLLQIENGKGNVAYRKVMVVHNK